VRILGIDTATSIASVALIENGELVSEETHPPKDRILAAPSGRVGANHAEAILPLIDAVLGRCGSLLQDLSGLAVSIGPGSFTGLRIGLSTVKGLAYSSRLPVVGVSTLLANATRVSDWEGLICSVLDARKNELYAALFRRQGPTLNRLTEDVVAAADSIVKLAESLGDPCLFVGEGAEVYRQWLSDRPGFKAHLPSTGTLSSVAAAVAHASQERLRRNEVDPVDTLIPLYARPSNAEFKSRDLL
jgi:tRNA threonylcarbamoyladenosine biosynthesis protein TsaB